MKTLIAWLSLCDIMARYFLSRLGLARRVRFIDRLHHSKVVAGQLFGWRRRLRVVAGDRCPREHPAIYISNHVKLDDPVFIWGAVDRASQERVSVRFMMRDDFFVGFPWSWLPFNMNDICEMCGAIGISRSGVQLSQVKPLIGILQEPGSFLMFPGWSRSRSGLVMEYRGLFEEPGGVAFFASHAMRRSPGLRVAAVPMMRTFNRVNYQSAVAFGEPLYLEEGAGRAGQRNYDFSLAVAISDLVEINMAHAVAGLAYLHCLHGRPVQISEAAFRRAAREALELPGRFRDPAITDAFDATFADTLRFFERSGMLTQQGDVVTLNAAAILSVPPLETKYRKENPVKFQVNQILHLADVVARFENAACGLVSADQ